MLWGLLPSPVVSYRSESWGAPPKAKPVSWHFQIESLSRKSQYSRPIRLRIAEAGPKPKEADQTHSKTLTETFEAGDEEKSLMGLGSTATLSLKFIIFKNSTEQRGRSQASSQPPPFSICASVGCRLLAVGCPCLCHCPCLPVALSLFVFRVPCYGTYEGPPNCWELFNFCNPGLGPNLKLKLRAVIHRKQNL